QSICTTLISSIFFDDTATTDLYTLSLHDALPIYLKAFQYYMQGRSYINRRTREDQLAAIHYCQKAIDEDRNYALAYAGLAEAHATLGVYGYIAPIEGRRKAEETAREALALDENLAEAHAALGQAYVQFAPSNFAMGDRELPHAIEL